jgi:hypothetical protein
MKKNQEHDDSYFFQVTSDSIIHFIPGTWDVPGDSGTASFVFTLRHIERMSILPFLYEVFRHIERIGGSKSFLGGSKS